MFFALSLDDILKFNNTMSKICELTMKKPGSGNKVSHSNRKTLRRFNCNIQPASFFSKTLNASYKFKVATSTLRTVDHKGGFDEFLTQLSTKQLSEKAIKIRRKIIKKIKTSSAISA